MRTKQSVYLGIGSGSLSAQEIAVLVGLEPDRVVVMASKRLEPPVPRAHLWAVECRDVGVQVSDQIETLVARLRPHHDALRAIATDPRVTICLQMVRYFHDDTGAADIEGWHLDADIMQFLASISAAVGCDEYDMVDDEGRDVGALAPSV